jgi:ABC-type cobalamin/Fe3+-siderophores transport system ATPase subunit
MRSTVLEITGLEAAGLEVAGLTWAYGSRVIVRPSGGGKSTLLRCPPGPLPTTRGLVVLDGDP